MSDDSPVAARSSRWTRWQLPAACAVAALFALGLSLRPFAVPWWQSHEGTAYPVRAVEYLRLWKMGVIYPRWCRDFYFGYGAPFFDFYPPLFFMLSAAFIALGLSSIVALKCVVVLSAMAAAVGLVGLVYGETKRLDAALYAALAFLLFPYRMYDVAFRGDLAEHLGLCLLPWALWGLRALGRASDAALPRTIGRFGLALAMVLLSHTIVGQWAVELVMVLGAVQIYFQRGARRRQAAAIFCGLAIAALISSIYTVPALVERSYVHIERMFEGVFEAARSPLDVRNIYRHVQWQFYGGELQLGAAVLVVIGFLLPATRRAARTTLWWWIPAVLFWFFISRSPLFHALWSGILPLGRYIQFPWRLTGFAGVTASVAVGVTVAAVLPVRLSSVLLPVLAVVLCLWGTERKEESYGPMAEAIISPPERVYGTTVLGEHLPREVLREPHYPRGALVLSSDGVRVDHSDQRRVAYRVVLTATRSGTADVQGFYFPGWRLRQIEGPAPATLTPTPMTGMMRINLPTAGHYEFSVELGLTPIQRLATAAALLGSALLLWFLFDKKRIAGIFSRLAGHQ